MIPAKIKGLNTEDTGVHRGKNPGVIHLAEQSVLGMR
jgi:hypothetical protein